MSRIKCFNFNKIYLATIKPKTNKETVNGQSLNSLPLNNLPATVRTLVQKKCDSFTCSFLALTYWFNLNLRSVRKKFSLFPTKPYFCIYCATHNKQMDEISKFQIEKKMSEKMHNGR